MEWYAKEARGLQALDAPDWADSELILAELASLEVRGDERWLATRFPALRTLGLRGRPRPQLVPPACHTLSLSYQVPPGFPSVSPCMRKGLSSACSFILSLTYNAVNAIE